MYLVHFERWTSPGNHPFNGTANTPGEFLIKEEIFNGTARPLGAMMMPTMFRNQLAMGFNRRQTRRLSYLFAVAPKGTTARRPDFPLPPSEDDLPGFPETWTFLRETYDELLVILEGIFTKRNSLFSSWTIADAACFGQLNMNGLREAGFRSKISKTAPKTLAWMDEIESGSFQFPVQKGPDEDNGYEDLVPLMSLVLRIFPPIMKQNEVAYNQIMADPTKLKIFNEQGFDQGLSLYDGKVTGFRYRSVVKTFQVEVWRKLKSKWRDILTDSDRESLNHSFSGIREAMENEHE